MVVNILILVVLILVILGLIFSQMYTEGKKSESFKDSDSYTARLAVINTFDKHLKRNPTPKEITKYSQFVNEKNIFEEIQKDFADEVSTTNVRSKKTNAKTMNKNMDKMKDNTRLERIHDKNKNEDYEDRQIGSAEDDDILHSLDEKKKKREKMQEANKNEEEGFEDEGEDEDYEDEDEDEDDESVDGISEEIDETDDKINVNTSMITGKTVNVPRANIVSLERQLSQVLTLLRETLDKQ